MPVIYCQNVNKIFKIPHQRIRSVKESLISVFTRKEYEVFHAVQDLSLEVNQGEFVSIIGPNGCGKSTLLKLIAGIYNPTSGKILVTDRMAPFLELGVGFNGDLTARENIYLYGAILGLTRREIKQRFDKIIEFSELEKFLDTHLRNFSSGMYVRLAFSIAVQSNAPILLFDEVLAVGDAHFQAKCFRLFEEMQKSGRTILYVSHDLPTIERFSDRVVWMDKGRKVAEGKAKEVTSAYKAAVGKV